MGASRQRIQAIALLSAVIAASCGGGGDSTPAPAPAPAPTQTPAPPPPPPPPPPAPSPPPPAPAPAPALTIGVMVNGVTVSPSGGSYAVAPGQTIALSSNKTVTWTPAAAAVTLRATSNTATQWSSQVLNPASTEATFAVTALAGSETVPINFTLAAGDARSGRYLMFGTNMVRYALTIDFDTSEYSIVSDAVGQAGTPVGSGAFTTDPNAPGEYKFDVAAAAGNSTARFRAGHDAIVGNYQFPGSATPMNFVAARKFATAAADFQSDVDLQILSREEVTGGGINTSLYTARYHGAVMTLCIHPGITAIDACPVAPIVYDLTFSADGKIDYVARPPTVETGSVHVARIGGSWVHLRAAENASGLKRFRVGIPLQPTLSATATIGDTRGNYGLVTVTAADVTFVGSGPVGAPNFGIGSFPNIVFSAGWPPGLFIYSETGVDQYFIGQSPELVVVNGARNLSNPFVNGYLAVGLRP